MVFSILKSPFPASSQLALHHDRAPQQAPAVSSRRLGLGSPAFSPILVARTPGLPLRPAAPLSATSSPGNWSGDVVTLDSVRCSLIRQEDSIIFALIERAQFHYNRETYQPACFPIMGFSGSLVEYMAKETEKMHAKVGRYKSPDETPFFPNLLPDLTLSVLAYPRVLHPAAASININTQVWGVYFSELLPKLVKKGSDGNYGSSAFCDVAILQALSKRIHYGMYVAEAKFQESPEEYEPAIRSQDEDKLMQMLTYPKVEEMVIRRVKAKASIIGQDVNPDGASTAPKIQPEVVAELYKKWIMPLTKEVEVQYLLKRLN